VSQGSYVSEKRTHLGANRILSDPKFGFRSKIRADEHCAAR